MARVLLFFPCQSEGLAREIWREVFAKSPMNHPAFSLFGPSRDAAQRLGLGDWYDWFKSQSQARVVSDPREVNGGVFVSFNPVREIADTFPELEGRAQRWLALDSAGNASSSCLLARKAGVERLLHADLVDEMASSVIPSALLYLMDRGIWLPNTALEPSDLSLPPEGAVPAGDERRLTLLFDEAFVEKRGLRFALDLFEGETSPLGCPANVVSTREFGRAAETRLPSHVVLYSHRLETVAELSRWASRHSIRMAIAETTETSPLRWLYAGGPRLESICSSATKLRPFFGALGRFVDTAPERDFLSDRPVGEWRPLQSLDAFAFAWDGSNQHPPFQPPALARFLSSSRGEGIAARSKRLVSNGSAFQYTPLYYSCEFFRESSPLDLLIDGELRTECRPGIDRLREMLDQGFKASQGYGAMYALHLSWCAILLGEHKQVLDTIAFVREPNFSALSGYACELGLGLWYEGEKAAAKECIETVARMEPDGRKWPFPFVAAAEFFDIIQNIDTNTKLCQPPSVPDDWIGSVYQALLADSDEDEAWREPTRMDPERAKAMKVRAEAGRAAG